MPKNAERPGQDGARGTPQPQNGDKSTSSPPEAGAGIASDLMVIFGITGDLARKMTFRALYRLERRRLLHCPIIGVAHDELTVEQLLTRAREAISGAGEALDDAVFDRLAARLS